ncbi:hypothetical protein L195_g063522, partial [Trifolium pratense]
MTKEIASDVGSVVINAVLDREDSGSILRNCDWEKAATAIERRLKSLDTRSDTG